MNRNCIGSELYSLKQEYNIILLPGVFCTVSPPALMIAWDLLSHNNNVLDDMATFPVCFVAENNKGFVQVHVNNLSILL